MDLTLSEPYRILQAGVRDFIHQHGDTSPKVGGGRKRPDQKTGDLIWCQGYYEPGNGSACHAKAHLGDVGRDVARLTTEVHGGMGFTDLLGLHYWFKRISFNRQILGGPERCRDEAADLQGWRLHA